MKNLQSILSSSAYDALPPAWQLDDLAAFSRDKSLWPYQQDALRYAVLALHRYFDGEADEPKRKERFHKRYGDSDVPLSPLLLGKKRSLWKLFGPYYSVTSGPRTGERQISYDQVINRISFWMATGSGKTLVIVKLLQALWTLMQRELVPQRDVLVLTYREDLLDQLRDHVQEYNSGASAPAIRLRELRAYPDAKREHPSLLSEDELTVFYYRSDILSDEQKEKLVDYRNYENSGQWYVLLDEAHKGESDDSKRQAIYSILSRSGFQFNFSATFVDENDRATTAYEYNLASFVKDRFGKHICLLQQENKAFRKGKDYDESEKQRIVLMSLLMLTYVAKARDRLVDVAGQPLYHRPLLLTLVNEVNTEDADLKLFFRELARVGANDVTDQAFVAAREALRKELSQPSPRYFFEGEEHFRLDDALLSGLTKKDVLRYVFNAETPGAVEVLMRPTNDKELAFRLKTSTSGAPFALIKIGEAKKWQKDELKDGYEFVKGFEDESFFKRLNEPTSEINLLMGSRSFYEGWDSNRPNVITFINIGGKNAEKFVLQAVGRGVRLEPVRGKRRRLEVLHEDFVVDDLTYQIAKPFLPAVESLFVFGASYDALEMILKGLKEADPLPDSVPLPLEVNPAVASAPHPLLVPVFRELNGRLLAEQSMVSAFELAKEEREQLLRAYVDYLDSDRLLLARHRLNAPQIGLLHRALNEPDTFFYDSGKRRYGSVNVLLPRLIEYFGEVPREVEGVFPVGDRISHYKQIRVALEELKLKELRRKIEQVADYVDPTQRVRQLRLEWRDGLISDQEMDDQTAEAFNRKPEASFEANGQWLRIKHLAEHYYLPMLLAKDDTRVDYITHIIQVPSEREFIDRLAAYLAEKDNLFGRYDWWMFSKTDEVLDKVVLPYYDGEQNHIRDFHPDFVFWFVKGQDYTVLFLDPKGQSQTQYQYKIDGYEEHLRIDGDYRAFTYPNPSHYGNYTVRVALQFFSNTPTRPPGLVDEYWSRSIEQLLRRLPGAS